MGHTRDGVREKIEEWANSTSRGWGDRGLAGNIHTVGNTRPWLVGLGWQDSHKILTAMS